METAADLLEKYKKRSFADGLFPFRPTLKALDENLSFAKICAKQDGRQRWVVRYSGTGNTYMLILCVIDSRQGDWGACNV